MSVCPIYAIFKTLHETTMQQFQVTAKSNVINENRHLLRNQEPCNLF